MLDLDFVGALPDGVIPPDFGGLIAMWASSPSGEPRLFVFRFGEGEPQGALRLTSLNLLQLDKILRTMIKEGEERGFITEDDHRQSALLPLSQGGEKIIPRSVVDRIAGYD